MDVTLLGGQETMAGLVMQSGQNSGAICEAKDVHRVVILTAIRVEYLAVRAHLSDLHEEISPQGTVYERGQFSCADALSWEVGLAEIGAGNVSAALEAERAITYFAPRVMLFVGVAGGIKDVTIGDVVAATKVYEYESGKAQALFLPRPEVSNTSHRMEQRARAEARKTDWLRRLPSAPSSTMPRVHIGPLAAGEKVIASTRATIYTFLRRQYSDTLAVEMEGCGFLQATHAHPHIDALIIRGISDLIDGKSAADATGSQEIAARHASAFAFEILAKLDGQQERDRFLEAQEKGATALESIAEVERARIERIQAETNAQVISHLVQQNEFLVTQVLRQYKAPSSRQDRHNHDTESLFGEDDRKRTAEGGSQVSIPPGSFSPLASKPIGQDTEELAEQLNAQLAQGSTEQRSVSPLSEAEKRLLEETAQKFLVDMRRCIGELEIDRAIGVAKELETWLGSQCSLLRFF